MDKVSLDDFEILRVLGRGAFGKVKKMRISIGEHQYSYLTFSN